MKRWIYWFVLGALCVAAVVALDGRRELRDLAAAAAFAMFAWVGITAWAVPISVVWWLVRGRRRARV